MKVGDRVRDRDFYCEGRIVAIYGRWAWIEIFGDVPGSTPITSQIASLDLIADDKAEAA